MQLWFLIYLTSLLCVGNSYDLPTNRFPEIQMPQSRRPVPRFQETTSVHRQLNANIRQDRLVGSPSEEFFDKPNYSASRGSPPRNPSHKNAFTMASDSINCQQQQGHQATALHAPQRQMNEGFARVPLTRVEGPHIGLPNPSSGPCMDPARTQQPQHQNPRGKHGEQVTQQGHQQQHHEPSKYQQPHQVLGPLHSKQDSGVTAHDIGHPVKEQPCIPGVPPCAPLQSIFSINPKCQPGFVLVGTRCRPAA